MTLFQTITSALRPIVDKMADTRFGSLCIEACLHTDSDDHFFAFITYYFKEGREGVRVTDIVLSCADCVEITDKRLLRECVNAARGHLRVRAWEVGRVERVVEHKDIGVS